ncbi:MAG: DUF3987 domain-containing protein [Blastocatellia bacterium]|nr:DUF3987 domain-containing protein [Blastocatellia bacterium]
MTEIKYERKCKNWLHSFGEWALPKSEAPESFVFWTGLFTLACAVRRQVYVPKENFGSWECAPNLYIMFIGQAGKVRKSTTVNYTEELIDMVSPPVPKAPEMITKESLLTAIVNSPDASMYMVAPEFGEFIVKSGPDMYSFLTNVYDGKRRISVSTLSRGVELADRPCCNLLGATTPEWVAANMPESVIGGGYASRVIFIHEKTVRRRKLYYRDLNHEQLELLRLDLVDDLSHISSLNGVFTIEPEAEKFMEDWYQRTADTYSEADYKMHGFFERLPAHIHKVAMLIRLAYSDELTLTIPDFKEAISLLKMVEKGLPDTFQAIGKNPYTVDMNRIFAFVKEKGRVTKQEVNQRFYHAANPAMLAELVNGLADMGKITMEFVNGTTFILPLGDNPKPRPAEKPAFDPTKIPILSIVPKLG